MIIVRLMGGLGNQMFQYAMGRSLACRLGTDLRLDTSFLRMSPPKGTPRSYQLDCFNIVASVATREDIGAILGEETFRKSMLAKIRKRIGLRWEQPHLFREPHYQYDEYFEQLPDDSYLVGYWHSERYFASVKVEIVTEFNCRLPLSGRNLEIAGEIERTNAVSLHVRRGDYVTDRKTGDFHGVCGLEYYRAAIAELVRHVRQPHFFVFSDDQPWVKEYLLFDYPTVFVDCNGSDNGHQDIRLMSRCKHNIIANSSFSWWGAWLNRNPAKTVIAPGKWLNNPHMDTKDVIPAGWIRL